jgi:hypothetical protein
MKGLVEEMRMLLEADIPRSDAVLKRLFPDAYESEEEATAYRELVDDELRSTKLRALKDVSMTLDVHGSDGATLTPEQAEEWLTLLTDMRLAIGTRLEVTEEKMDAEIDDDNPDAPAYSVLHWLGWIQEMMLRAMN